MSWKCLVTMMIILTVIASCAINERKSTVDTFDPNEKIAISDTTGKLMKESDFWAIIDKSRKMANNNYESQKKTIQKVLVTLDEKQIERFDNSFTNFIATAFDFRILGAAYVINGGCSDDCFSYFLQYLIANGKERFYQTCKDPDSCADWVKSEDEDNWEGFQYAIMDAYKQKTGKELPKTFIPDFKVKGKRFQEESLMNEYPKLAKKFM